MWKNRRELRKSVSADCLFLQKKYREINEKRNGKLEKKEHDMVKRHKKQLENCETLSK